MAKDKNKTNIVDMVLIISTMITSIMFPLVFFEEVIESQGILLGFFSTLIFGFGGFGIGVILVYNLDKILKGVTKR